jgi:hypothetical protein
VADAVVFGSKKPIYFLDDFEHSLRVLFVCGLLAEFLPPFSGLTLHRSASVHPLKRPSTIHESAENVCSLDCEAEYARKQSCRLKALSGHKLPIYMRV